MKFKLSVLLLFVACFCYGKGSGKISPPSGYGIAYYGHDTTFYSPDSLKNIWNIKKGNYVYEFSGFGNLTSISKIKRNTSKSAFSIFFRSEFPNEYILDGISFLYYDDSTCTLAGVGEFDNGKEGENWRYYDRKGRITKITYPVPLCTRNDYYDSLGNLISEVDYTETPDKYLKVRDIEYINGKRKVVTDRMLIDIFILHFAVIYTLILLVLFFSRTIFNYVFYSREDEKFPYPQKWFSFYPSNLTVCLFSFWFSEYKPENKWLAKINNTFILIVLVMFLGEILLEIMSGDIT